MGHIYGNIFSHMKTTIDLPDELLIRAKKHAAEARTTLREIFERGLRRGGLARTLRTPLSQEDAGRLAAWALEYLRVSTEEQRRGRASPDMWGASGRRTTWREQQ